nr:MAG TPA: putative nucleotide kinase [Caudoviricetes sp.]
MKIILEGVDGAGKTTLAKILAEKYGLDICHCTQYDAADYDFYRQTVRKENVVWDRHTLGELIYPKIFNRKQQIGTEDARLVMHYAKQEGVIVLVLTADMPVLYERLDMRKEKEHKLIMENLDYINEQFKFYANEFHVPIIDTTKMTLQQIFDLVESKQIA